MPSLSLPVAHAPDDKWSGEHVGSNDEASRHFDTNVEPEGSSSWSVCSDEDMFTLTAALDGRLAGNLPDTVRYSWHDRPGALCLAALVDGDVHGSFVYSQCQFVPQQCVHGMLCDSLPRHPTELGVVVFAHPADEDPRRNASSAGPRLLLVNPLGDPATYPKHRRRFQAKGRNAATPDNLRARVRAYVANDPRFEDDNAGVLNNYDKHVEWVFPGDEAYSQPCPVCQEPF
ncbi:hypothetical protein Q5752_006932 [Cryptotrichosporon argae]